MMPLVQFWWFGGGESFYPSGKPVNDHQEVAFPPYSVGQSHDGIVDVEFLERQLGNGEGASVRFEAEGVGCVSGKPDSL